ncbi:hypothetical protein FKM82_017595 [Ascaphus truei]
MVLSAVAWPLLSFQCLPLSMEILLTSLDLTFCFGLYYAALWNPLDLSLDFLRCRLLQPLDTAHGQSTMLLSPLHDPGLWTIDYAALSNPRPLAYELNPSMPELSSTVPFNILVTRTTYATSTLRPCPRFLLGVWFYPFHLSLGVSSGLWAGRVLQLILPGCKTVQNVLFVVPLTRTDCNMLVCGTKHSNSGNICIINSS